MTCPKCNKEFTHNFDKFSIEKNKRCVDCQKKWEALPENNPDFKPFEFTYVIRERTTIYAANEDDAREEFEGEFEYTDYDMEELKKK